MARAQFLKGKRKFKGCVKMANRVLGEVGEGSSAAGGKGAAKAKKRDNCKAAIAAAEKVHSTAMVHPLALDASETAIGKAKGALKNGKFKKCEKMAERAVFLVERSGS